MAKDYFGNDLAVGDTVAFMETGYRNLTTGTITKITAVMVFISHKKHGYYTETKQTHDQVIRKITQPGNET